MGNSRTRQVHARPAWPDSAVLGQVQPAAGKEIPKTAARQGAAERAGKASECPR